MAAVGMGATAAAMGWKAVTLLKTPSGGGMHIRKERRRSAKDSVVMNKTANATNATNRTNRVNRTSGSGSGGGGVYKCM